MADAGFITRERAEQAKKAPIVTVGGRPSTPTPPFFVEEVRQQLEERYGAQQLYENGLAVYTTLDLKLQHAAEARAGRRACAGSIAGAGSASRSASTRPAVESYTHPSWTPGTRRAASRRWARRSSPS